MNDRRPSEGGSNWNRAGRRSGGHKPRALPVGRPVKELPALSIQCYESRHGDCCGTMAPFAPGACECPCHEKQ